MKLKYSNKSLGRYVQTEKNLNASSLSQHLFFMDKSPRSKDYCTWQKERSIRTEGGIGMVVISLWPFSENKNANWNLCIRQN